MKRPIAALLSSLLLVTFAAAQKATIVFCALGEPPDFKTAKGGDSSRCAPRAMCSTAARCIAGRRLACDVFALVS
jgi:hypothetical protein